MADVVLLDAGPLGMISHPRPATEIVTWFATLLNARIKIVIPEIADFEVRRELLRAGRAKGIRRLDELKASLRYLPITTEAMLKAAEFWADARRRGQPTASDDSLDADAILAAQAAMVLGDAVVASTNPKHLSRFVRADHWSNIAP